MTIFDFNLQEIKFILKLDIVLFSYLFWQFISSCQNIQISTEISTLEKNFPVELDGYLILSLV